MVKHRHHKTPKHMGGTNDPSNLIDLTIEEHAEAHRQLFEQYGNWQDELAWKTLSGQISNAEAIKTAQRLANLGDSNPTKRPEVREKMRLARVGRKLSETHKARIRAKSIFITENNPGKNPSIETRKKMAKSHKGWTNNPKGNKENLPSMKDTIWITNGVVRKKIHKTAEIPNGYKRGMK